MAIAYLYPTATSDPSGLLSSGNHTAIDETSGDGTGTGDSTYCSTNTNDQTGKTVTFTMSDLPAEATSINSVLMRVRARMVGVDPPDGTDVTNYRVRIASDTACAVTYTQINTTESAKTDTSTLSTVAAVNAAQIEVEQTFFSKISAFDNSYFQIEFIELVVNYEAVVNVDLGTPDGVQAQSQTGKPSLTAAAALGTPRHVQAKVEVDAPTATYSAAPVALGTPDGVQAQAQTGKPSLSAHASLNVNGVEAQAQTGKPSLATSADLGTPRHVQAKVEVDAVTATYQSKLVALGSPTDVEAQAQTGKPSLSAHASLNVNGVEAQAQTGTPSMSTQTDLGTARHVQAKIEVDTVTATYQPKLIPLGAATGVEAQAQTGTPSMSANAALNVNGVEAQAQTGTPAFAVNYTLGTPRHIQAKVEVTSVTATYQSKLVALGSPTGVEAQAQTGTPTCALVDIELGAARGVQAKVEAGAPTATYVQTNVALGTPRHVQAKVEVDSVTATFVDTNDELGTPRGVQAKIEVSSVTATFVDTNDELGAARGVQARIEVGAPTASFYYAFDPTNGGVESASEVTSPAMSQAHTGFGALSVESASTVSVATITIGAGTAACPYQVTLRNTLCPTLRSTLTDTLRQGEE